jgi:hypothetical protein
MLMSVKISSKLVNADEFPLKHKITYYWWGDYRNQLLQQILGIVKAYMQKKRSILS